MRTTSLGRMVARTMAAATLAMTAMVAQTMAAAAQTAGSGNAGPRAVLPRAEEIALARSAAPHDVSDTAADVGLGDVPSLEAAVVVDPGTPFANLMVVVKDHVAVAEATGSNR